MWLKSKLIDDGGWFVVGRFRDRRTGRWEEGVIVEVDFKWLFEWRNKRSRGVVQIPLISRVQGSMRKNSWGKEV